MTDTMIARAGIPSPTTTTTTAARHRTARLAGLAYLALVIQGLFALEYVPRLLFVADDAAATALRIQAAQPLYVAWLVNSLILLVTFPLLALLLYRLFEGVNRGWAGAMLALVLVQVPPAITELQRQLGALQLVRGGGFLSGLDPAQRDILALLQLDAGGQTVAPLMLFWGLWLFPLGALVYRSGFMPRWLGLWLVVNGVAYVALSVLRLVAPQDADAALLIAMPALLAELVLMLWLLIRGAPPPAAQRA